VALGDECRVGASQRKSRVRFEAFDEGMQRNCRNLVLYIGEREMGEGFEHGPRCEAETRREWAWFGAVKAESEANAAAKSARNKKAQVEHDAGGSSLLVATAALQ
jgi:hypothetical protein